MYNRTWRLVTDITHLLSFTRISQLVVYRRPALLSLLVRCIAMLQNTEPFVRRVTDHVEYDTYTLDFSLMEQNYSELVTGLLAGLRAGPSADVPRDLVAERASFPRRTLTQEECSQLRAAVAIVTNEIAAWARAYYGEAKLSMAPMLDVQKEGIYVHLTLQRLFAAVVSAALSQFQIASLTDIVTCQQPMPLPLADVICALPLHLQRVVASSLLGLWKRNGEAFATEMALYSHNSSTHSRLVNDIGAMQLAVCLMQSGQFSTVRPASYSI